MPIIPDYKFYEVTQTRKVRVRAESSVDAVRIATEAFDANDNAMGVSGIAIDEINGNTVNPIRVTSVNVELDERI